MPVLWFGKTIKYVLISGFYRVFVTYLLSKSSLVFRLQTHNSSMYIFTNSEICNQINQNRNFLQDLWLNLIDLTMSTFFPKKATLQFCFKGSNGTSTETQLSNLWWMPNWVSIGFDSAMKTGSSRRLKRYSTTYGCVSKWLPFTVD